MRSRLADKEKRFLERARVCRVGSVNKRGVTHVAPFVHAFDRSARTAYISTEEDGVTARNVRAHPRAALVCDDYVEDWDRLRGVEVHVRAKEVRRGPSLERGRRLLEKKFKQMREYEVEYLIELRVERVTSWGL